jgi:hypothetical protein
MGYDYGYNAAVEKAKREKHRVVSTFFRYCPLCYMGNAVRLHVHGVGGRDVAICSRCGASWHVYFGFWGGLKWAKLEKESHDGKGREHLGIEHEPEFWSKLAFEARADYEEKRTIVRETKIVTEIVKIRCQFCGNLYDESIDRCPYCFGHRR